MLAYRAPYRLCTCLVQLGVSWFGFRTSSSTYHPQKIALQHRVANAAISTAGLALWPLIWTAGGLVPSSPVLDHLASADLAGLDGLVNSLDTSS
jgi:hypothetical protein